jgi:hypothetical protein
MAPCRAAFLALLPALSEAASGQIVRVWLLTPEELAQPRKPAGGGE